METVVNLKVEENRV